MQALALDIRLGLRALAASPTQSAIAVLTLALGLGVGAAVFSVLDAVIFRPVPFVDAARMVEIWNFDTKTKFSNPRMPRALFLEWRKQTDLFDRVEGYEATSAIYDVRGGSETAPASFVTPGLMPMLGVAPLMGRYFVDGDGRDGSDDRVVISERFWRQTLDRDPAVVGRSLQINGRPHTVIGVMPASFYFPYSKQQLWLPLDADDPPATKLAGRITLEPFARLRADRSLVAADEEVLRRGAPLNAATGGRPDLTATLRQKGQFSDENTARALTVLGGAAGFLLLIVCANIANLSLARTLTRARDYAVRASLGASRGDLVRSTLVENLIIGLVGAVLALLVAMVALDTATSTMPALVSLSSLNAIDLDARVLLFAAIAGIVSSILFGLPPALLASRPGIIALLRQDSRTAAGSGAASRLRSGLVVAEVTIAIILLVGAALMGRSFWNLYSIERGFDTTGLVAVRVGLPTRGYLDPAARDRFTDTLIGHLKAIPGVVSASAGSVPPDSSLISWGRVEFADAPDRTTAKPLIFPIYQVWPDYFDTIRLPLKEGRTFGPADPEGAVVISETFAQDYWPGASAVGARFRFVGDRSWRTVVGVAADVRQLDLDDANTTYEWFEPLQTHPAAAAPPAPPSTTAIIDYRTLLVRTPDPASVLRVVSQAVHTVDPRVVVWQTSEVDDLFAESIARPRTVFVMLIVFSALGLVLAAAGIYGVLSYLVNQRMREIGIRLALGATPAGVFGIILKSGLSLTLIGLGVGVLASAWVVRLTQTMLYQVNSFDPAVFAAVSVLTLLTALVACWRPARRAMRVDPVRLLREQ